MENFISGTSLISKIGHLVSILQYIKQDTFFLLTQYIGDCEYVKIFSFAVFGINLRLEEDGDLNRNDPLYSFNFIQSKAQD